MSPFESLVARVRGEYQEMPGLRLTFAQACRLWQMDAPTCERLLEQLVRERFLYKTDTGCYRALPSVVGRQEKAQLRERVSLPRSA
jgi:DNA-binding IclR family transcriptional regulator